MVDLKLHLKELGFDHIQTYIQSENIVFTAVNGDCYAFAKAIKEKIVSVYGFEVPVIVLIAERLEKKKILKEWPFFKEIMEQSYFTVLHNIPETSIVETINTLVLTDEKHKVTPHCVYLYVPEGYGRAKGNNNFFEKKLGVIATTRNCKTIKKTY